MAKLRNLSAYRSQLKQESKSIDSHSCYRFNEALLFPLSDIFPKLFFLKELDEQWVKLFHNLTEENHIKRWDNNLNQRKLEILLKCSLEYLDHGEKEAVFVYHLRNFFKSIKHDQIGLKEIVEQSKLLLTMAESWEKTDSNPSPIRSLGQSYLLFILTLNNSVYKPDHQRKILNLAHLYGEKAKGEIEERDGKTQHPYFGLLFCLLHIARGNWDAGTKELHALAIQYPDPKLYEVLSKLYIKIGLPNVAQFFKNKLDHLSSDDSDAFESELNSVLSPFMNCA